LLFPILRQIFDVASEVKNESRNNIKLQRWIAIASATLLIAKFTAYYLTRSVSILTDALESIVNVIAGFIGLYSL
jgi:cation diffusion facilitator family transporter